MACVNGNIEVTHYDSEDISSKELHELHGSEVVEKGVSGAWRLADDGHL